MSHALTFQRECVPKPQDVFSLLWPHPSIINMHVYVYVDLVGKMYIWLKRLCICTLLTICFPHMQVYTHVPCTKVFHFWAIHCYFDLLQVTEAIVRQRKKLGDTAKVTEDMCVTHFLIQPDPEGVKLQGWNERAFSECKLVWTLYTNYSYAVVWYEFLQFILL